MKRILIISALLLAVVFTATADRRRLMMARNVSTGVTSPTPELVWWKLNEGSGTSIAGSAAIADDGTTDASWLTGKSGSGSCLDFDGSTDDAATSSTIAFGTQTLLVTAWVYFDATNGTQIIWESSASYSANNDSFICFVNAGQITVGFSQPAGNTWIESGQAPATGAWTHLAVYYRATGGGNNNITVYYNGADQSFTTSSTTATAARNFSTQTLFVGARNSGSLFFNGRIDDLRVYSTDQTSSLADIGTDAQ